MSETATSTPHTDAAAETSQIVRESAKWVTFNLARETYCVAVASVHEVLRYTEIAPVPGAPPYVLGIINLRGDVVTIVDARRLFGLAPGKLSAQSRIIIVESAQSVTGVLVDSVTEVVDLQASEIEISPNVNHERAAKFIHGVCHRNGRLLVLVDFTEELDRAGD